MSNITIRTVPARGEAVKRPLSWYEFNIKKMQLKGKTLHIIDGRAGGEAVISKGFHSIYLFYFLKPGDKITLEGFVTRAGSVHGSGQSYFRDPAPSPAALQAREAEAEGKAEEYYYSLD